ncbi:MAG: prepilin peptidase [Phycisphaeraceae bacterium]
MTPTEWMWLVFVTLAGGCVGSFLNVVVYRLPRGESIVSPPSACPRCGHKLAAYDNVPVLGWLWLRGKCRYCAQPISPEYPIVEAIAAVLFGGWFFICYGTALQPGFAGPGLEETALIFGVTLTLLGGLLAATLIDARLYIIPLQIPWLVSAVALVMLPLAVWLFPLAVVEVELPSPERRGLLLSVGERLADVPEPYDNSAAVLAAVTFRDEGPVTVTAAPYVTGPAMWAAIVGMFGLILANVLVWRGLLPRSFADEEEHFKQDENYDPNDPEGFLSYPHARREMLKEALFLALPIGGFALGWYLAADAEVGPVGSVFGGVLTGYLAGGLTVWATRLLGTLGFGREAMGLGDVHLMAAVGAVAGWQVAVLAFFVAPFFGLGWAVLAAGAAKLMNRQVRAIPYGPHLAVATVVVMIFREPLLEQLALVLL